MNELFAFFKLPDIYRENFCFSKLRAACRLVFETALAGRFLRKMRNGQHESSFKGVIDAGIRYPEDQPLGSRRGCGFSVGGKVTCFDMQKQQGLPGVIFGSVS